MFYPIAVRMLLVAALGAGCRRAVVSAPAPVQLREAYCWWAVLRSARSPDSVAARFTSAYIQAGFSTVTFKKSADTAWAAAGPTQLGSANSALYASRAVAYWHGDSTHFRYYVSVGPPMRGNVQTTDSVDTAKLLLGLCAQVARAAAIGWSAPPSPTGEETLELWTRIP
jgi:hypothetical protein